MKLRIYREKNRKEQEKYLQLIPCGDHVVVVLVDVDGQFLGNLVEFKSTGTLYRYPDIECLGFQGEDKGRIKLDKTFNS